MTPSEVLSVNLTGQPSALLSDVSRAASSAAHLKELLIAPKAPAIANVEKHALLHIN